MKSTLSLLCLAILCVGNIFGAQASFEKPRYIYLQRSHQTIIEQSTLYPTVFRATTSSCLASRLSNPTLVVTFDENMKPELEKASEYRFDRHKNQLQLVDTKGGIRGILRRFDLKAAVFPGNFIIKPSE